MKAIYKPIGLIIGILSGLIGKRIFDFVWILHRRRDPLKGTTKNAPGKIFVRRRWFAIFKATWVAANTGRACLELPHWDLARRAASGSGLGPPQHEPPSRTPSAPQP